jgi:hypothetical protein
MNTVKNLNMQLPRVPPRRTFRRARDAGVHREMSDHKKCRRLWRGMNRDFVRRASQRPRNTGNVYVFDLDAKPRAKRLTNVAVVERENLNMQLLSAKPLVERPRVEAGPGDHDARAFVAEDAARNALAKSKPLHGCVLGRGVRRYTIALTRHAWRRRRRRLDDAFVVSRR